MGARKGQNDTDLVFSVFFAVMFGPFMSAVFALVMVLKLFNVQYDWSLVMHDDGYGYHVSPCLTDSMR